ncbi:MULTISPECIES: OmpA family protein [unclassified Rathayibacter]|uniref:OmpA family protein n=1 Tax=unclassified Rathayibacter TaxID=2609250 RepID=UPI0006F2C007|nr:MULTISPECIES: OmpA family protein [unclassified Rathayibacter]KQQ06113.1 hypothetical protein ASF42_06235 [Rathayibacter sp. Leaf294]KQS13970.1 hypothetical protein ASG06_06245 [Rathayibacter sp. Leaf185]
MIVTTPLRAGRAARTRLALLVAAALGASVLAGCGPVEDTGGDEVVIVAGTRANSPAVSTATVLEALDRIDAVGDRLVVVGVEGSPRVLFDLTLDDLPGNGRSRSDRLDQIKNTAAAAVVAARPESAEADLTEAIALGSAPFSPDARSRTMVILDSMLQTAGGLAMLDGALYRDPADRIAALEESGGVPDLRGVAVSAPRLGVVVSPQSELTSSARAALQSQWQAFFEASGAEVDWSSSSLVAQAQPTADLPAVTPIDVARPTVEAGGCRGVLPDAAIGYRSDTAEFVDEAAALATIAEIAEALAGCEGEVLIEASTSSVGDESVNVPLSEERGRAAAEPLATALGIDVSAVRIVGYGSSWPCRVSDRDAEGRLIERAAAQNRTVVVSRGDASGTCP